MLTLLITVANQNQLPQSLENSMTDSEEAFLQTLPYLKFRWK